MALKDTNIDSEYPYVFMLEQSIFQSKIKNSSDNPKYTLSLAWVYYKLELDGSMIFKPSQVQNYYDGDFYVSAVTDMMAGDNSHVNTLSFQQLSIKKIVEAETGLTLEVVQ